MDQGGKFQRWLNNPDAKGVLGDYKDLTDPTYVGPGTWAIIHKKAFMARSREEQLEFIRFVKSVCENFGCKVCSGHCKKYIEENPMEWFMDIDHQIGEDKGMSMFVWAWAFHNVVNFRLKKPQMSLETAYYMFNNNKVGYCSAACEEAKEASVPSTGRVKVVGNYHSVKKPILRKH